MRADFGRDRRVVHHRAPQARNSRRLDHRPRVVIAGAGIAGLTAATGLAERGIAVEIIERRAHLGGRVGGWTDNLPDGTPITVNRGFHAFFRQYYNLRALLRRTDPQLHRLRAIDDYPLVDGHGRHDTFRRLPRTPPWNALAFAARSPTFPLHDLRRIDARAAAPLAAVSVPGIYDQLDHLDAETFLQRINFPATARHLAFDVFSRSFFAPPTQLSAAELATMFHIYFLGSSEGLLFDVPTSNYDTALWSPLRDYLSSHDVRIRTGATVTTVETGGDRAFRVREQDGRDSAADAVVLATDVTGLRAIVEQSPRLGDRAWRESIGQLRSAPSFLVYRIWLNKPVAPHRPAFLATGGLTPLDNVSVVNHYEQQARTWAESHNGAVLELHAYALPERRTPNQEHDIRARLRARLHDLYPETADAQILGEHLQWNQDCPLFGVGDHAHRPTVRTPHDGLVLAGDGIRIDLPVALMERAATTGWAAANALLTQWGLPGHDLYTVPTSGRNALLRRLATRYAAATSPAEDLR
ncbi:FAD-dependent oxidoreductase [Nocardia speluncae]|uniref:FAD-dependent oxidoreductase n=1 Tax=Nocardia speluncae TaxID=419477 RepID=A0A846XDT7_9NOCA|nr:NAD(P)/FAD-dependent oxidoreductase [Nocardia speluncae]NKY32900.1 FAD-dependent oxidoreductase [Nocardia speluncae]